MPYHYAKHRKPVTDVLRQTVTDDLPEIADIHDPALRHGAVEAWAYALACSDFRRIADIPPACGSAWNFGSDSISVQFEGLGCTWDDEACPEEIKPSAAIHLAFDKLQLGDLTLGLSVRPRLGQGGSHRVHVGFDAFANEASRLSPVFASHGVSDRRRPLAACDGSVPSGRAPRREQAHRFRSRPP